MIWKRVGSPPQVSTWAARTRELYSMISPGRGWLPGGTSSVPVGRMATRGFRRTRTSLYPHPAIAPRSTGRSRCPAGRTSWVAIISSPIARTCSQGADGARRRMAPADPSAPLAASGSTCSLGTTASAQAGIGSPVSTRRAALPKASVTGSLSLAPSVASLRIAYPSIAAA